jgi:transposase InsO family protein
MLRKELLDKAMKKEVTQQEVGKRLGVSRQTISKWIYRYRRYGEEGLFPAKRKKRKIPPVNKTPKEKEDIILGYAEKYWNEGVESLSDRIMADTGISIHSTTIYRILRRKKVRYTNEWNGTRKRTRKKLYFHREAGQEIQIDTTYPFGYKQGKVVYTAIDDASRFVFARMYSTANGKNSQDFVEHILKRSPFPIHKIRSDNGKEFIKSEFRRFLKKNNIIHRTNTPYCPEENGKIERFHGTLKQQSVQYYWYPSDTLETLEYKLQSFLHYYNFQKRHRGLGMNGLTPYQKLSLLAFSPKLFSEQNVNLTLQCNKN